MSGPLSASIQLGWTGVVSITCDNTPPANFVCHSVEHIAGEAGGRMCSQMVLYKSLGGGKEARGNRPRMLRGREPFNGHPTFPRVRGLHFSWFQMKALWESCGVHSCLGFPFIVVFVHVGGWWAGAPYSLSFYRQATCLVRVSVYVCACGRQQAFDATPLQSYNDNLFPGSLCPSPALYPSPSPSNDNNWFGLLFSCSPVQRLR